MSTRLSDRKWNKIDAEHRAYCQNCDWQGHSDDLDPIGDIHERTEEGDTVWAGDCPECGAMSFTVAEMDKQTKETNQKQAARAMLAALQAIQALPTAAVDCVRGGVDLPAIIALAQAAGIELPKEVTTAA